MKKSFWKSDLGVAIWGPWVLFLGTLGGAMFGMYLASHVSIQTNPIVKVSPVTHIVVNKTDYTCHVIKRYYPTVKDN